MTIMKGTRTNNLMSRTFSLTKQIRSLGHQQDLWSNYLPKFSRTICSPVRHGNLFCQTNQGTRIFYSRLPTWTEGSGTICQGLQGNMTRTLGNSCIGSQPRFGLSTTALDLFT